MADQPGGAARPGEVAVGGGVKAGGVGRRADEGAAGIAHQIPTARRYDFPAVSRHDGTAVLVDEPVSIASPCGQNAPAVLADEVRGFRHGTAAIPPIKLLPSSPIRLPPSCRSVAAPVVTRLLGALVEIPIRTLLIVVAGSAGLAAMAASALVSCLRASAAGWRAGRSRSGVHHDLGEADPRLGLPGTRPRARR